MVSFVSYQPIRFAADLLFIPEDDLERQKPADYQGDASAQYSRVPLQYRTPNKPVRKACRTFKGGPKRRATLDFFEITKSEFTERIKNEAQPAPKLAERVRRRSPEPQLYHNEDEFLFQFQHIHPTTMQSRTKPTPSHPTGPTCPPSTCVSLPPATDPPTHLRPLLRPQTRHHVSETSQLRVQVHPLDE